MKIHREGIRIIGFTIIMLAILNFVLFYFMNEYIAYFGLVLTVLILAFVLNFFRNPPREGSSKPNQIIAPVDGKVVVLEKVFEKEYLKKECLQLSIFMSPLNVHVCRYPVSGEVIFKKYHPGKYLVAWHPKSSELNERTTTVVKTKDGSEVLFRQIAGAIARRIVQYSQVGDQAKSGEEYGFIKFGSRLDIFLPLDTKVLCKLGDKPRGGEDILAELNF